MSASVTELGLWTLPIAVFGSVVTPLPSAAAPGPSGPGTSW